MSKMYEIIFVISFPFYCNRQTPLFECDFYMIYWIRVTIWLNIIDSWTKYLMINLVNEMFQVFNDQSPLCQDDIKKLRE